MQNDTPYYKAQNDPFGGFVPLPFQCSCSYVFSLSVSGSGDLSTYISDCDVSASVCVCVVCMRAMRIWVPTFSVCPACVYLYSPRAPFKMSPSDLGSTEVWRNINKGQERRARERERVSGAASGLGGLSVPGWTLTKCLSRASGLCRPSPSPSHLPDSHRAPLGKGTHLDTWPPTAPFDFPDEKPQVASAAD